MARPKPDNPIPHDKIKKARQANAEKQKRYRESMKAQGYKARLIWEKPLDTGTVRGTAPVIQESSINTAKSNPAVREALEELCWTFVSDCKKKDVPKKEWNPVYQDIQILLKPLLGIQWVTK